MALTILLTLILIALSILVWCKWEERKWLDDGEYVHLTKPKTAKVKLYRYDAGTTNPKDTYTTPIKFSENPTILDYAGNEAKNDFIEKQLAEARAAVDDKMPDDAIFHKCVPECKPNSHIATDKPKAMKAPIIPKGWKRHDGGKRPVRWHTMVDVLFGAGDQWDNSRAIDWEWESTGKVAQDIIAYRIVKPKKPKA